MKNKRRFHLLYTIICAIAGSTAIALLTITSGDITASYYGPYSIIVALGLFYLYKTELFNKDYSIKYLILSALISISTVGGAFLDAGTSFENSDIVDCIKFIIICLLLLPAFYCLLIKANNIVSRASCSRIEKHIDNNRRYYFNYWIITTIIILFAWGLVWLAYFPGLWNYDPYQVWEYINKDYDTRHPLIHTVLMGFCFNVGYKIGKPNIGVALYDWVQMIIMASIFSYSVLLIKQKTNCWFICIITILFYSIFPVNSILSISSTKDSLFSAFVLLNTILATKFLEHINNNDINECHRIIPALIITTVVMLMFRNNASYAYAAFCVITAALALFKKIPWKAVIIFACCLILYFGCNSTLVKCLDAKNSSITEALSVPAQQFGRIYFSDSADEQTKNIIERYCDKSRMSYNPYLADTMKSANTIHDIKTWSDARSFLQTSLMFFLRYPSVSIDSFLYLTEGWWYLGDTSCANIYGGSSSDRLGYLETKVFDGFGVTHNSKLPALEKLFEYLFTSNSYQKLPLISLLFAPALYIWLFVFALLSFNRREQIPYIFYLFLLLTNLLGPCCLVRYAYPFIASMPLMLATLMKDNKISLETQNIV